MLLVGYCLGVWLYRLGWWASTSIWTPNQLSCPCGSAHRAFTTLLFTPTLRSSYTCPAPAYLLSSSLWMAWWEAVNPRREPMVWVRRQTERLDRITTRLKFVNLKRSVDAMLDRDAILAYWMARRGNWGDVINPLLIGAISSRRVVWANEMFIPPGHCVHLVVGSTLSGMCQ